MAQQDSKSARLAAAARERRRRLREQDPAAWEAQKAARRVEPTETWCAACGEMFTPKRSDAKTCSDRCRQALRRKTQERVTAKRVASTRKRRTDTTNRDRKGT